MKFDCGEDPLKKGLREEDRLRGWHTKFAWFPVRIGDNDCRWLEFVERKCPSAYYTRCGNKIVLSSNIYDDKEYRAIDKQNDASTK